MMFLTDRNAVKHHSPGPRSVAPGECRNIAPTLKGSNRDEPAGHAVDTSSYLPRDFTAGPFVEPRWGSLLGVAMQPGAALRGPGL